jgi:aspartate/methionine/tyrosine aminotransferase
LGKFHSQQAKRVGVPLRYPTDTQDGTPLSANDLTLDLAELDAAINSSTKLLVLNTPHNPSGKVFSMVELEGIADVVRRHPQVIVVSDEVYEYSVFPGQTHHRMSPLSTSFLNW